MTELRLFRTSVSGDIASVAGLVHLTRLWLDQTSVSGDIASVAGLVHLTELNLEADGIKAPVNCPRNEAGELEYRDQAACKRLLEWLGEDTAAGDMADE